MSSYHLLFYTHGLVGGGAERVWARLASGMAERGHRVDFVADFAAEQNLPFLSDKVRLRILPRGHVRAVIGLAAILRDERPDAALSAISISNLKLWLAGTLAGRGQHSILSYHGFYENEPQFLSRLGYGFSRRMIASAGATIAVSQSLRRHLVERFSASAAKVTTIYNPAAIEPFPAPVDPAELAGRAPQVVAIGRLVPDKGFDFMLRAFARVRNKAARLVIFGEGPERGRLEALARELGIADRVELPGFSSRVHETLASARCFALSSYHETFSLALVEAMSYGLPAVVTASGGPPEVLGNPELGRIVPGGDEMAFAEALDAMLATPGDPQARQERARHFSLDMALDAYERLIRKVVTEAGG